MNRRGKEMYIDSVNCDEYIKQMNQLKQMSRMLHLLQHGEIYKNGLRVKRYKDLFNGFSFKKFKNFIKGKIDHKVLEKKISSFKRIEIGIMESNYFSTEKIAVYTCIFGNYDKIYEPIVCPDNIDYYIITDQSNIRSTKWKKVNIKCFHEIIKDFSNIEKNRWFKMHPAEVFGNHYRYSIYIDGNILPITDFTEFTNRIGSTGIAMFWHKYNNCVYQEALYNIYDIKKTKKEEIRNQIKYLRHCGMPENYGMTTCNVIARDHKNPICIEIMDSWWKEYISHCRRDQLSFPFVVWKKGFSMSDIASLGNDVWNEDSLLVMEHR